MKHTIRRFTFALLVLSLLLTAPRAQQPATPTPERVTLYQALLDLQNPWTVMCVAAHPDDEDGTSLIVMRRKYGAHTVSLFSTFGEGGQNAIGPELYEELGAIRARETMAASEIQGSEPHFLGLKDFGFSKTRDEAFKFWGHEEALRRMVLEIRKLRPDVIITNHSTTSNDHGQHQATALMVVEAFDAAADPNKFPEQLKDGVTTWQVQRLFVRSRGNQAPAADAAIVTIDPNEVDPVRGTMFAEQALSALQKHATQGPWPKTFAEFTARFRAFSGQGGATGQMPLIRYTLVRQAKGAQALAGDTHNFLSGLRLPDSAGLFTAPLIDGRPLTDFVDQKEKVFNALLSAADASQKSFADLIEAPPEQRPVRMYLRLSAALSALAGVSAKLSSNGQVLIPGENVTLDLELTNAGKEPVRIAAIASGLGDRESNAILPTTQPKEPILNAGASTKIPITLRVPRELGLTVPHARHLYEKSFAGVAVVAGAYVEVNHKRFSVGAHRLFDVTPPVDIADISPSLLVIRPDEVGVSSAGADVFPAKLPDLKIQLINYLDQRTNVEVLLGQKNQPPQAVQKVELLPHQIANLAMPIPRPEKATAAHARAATSGEALMVTVRAANSRAALTTREVPVVRANAHVARNLRVGYVRGFDFSLPNALNALGVESKELSADEVKTADLSKFTSFIVDNRVYESQPELIAANQKLLDYANAGGNLIVFYHKSDEWNPNEQRKRPQLAPYKLILGNERVTDENAPITFLQADHPLLNVPNKLNQDDFKDWIQERGLYYPREWDPQFHALLQSNDPGEAPLKGGLLVADYGSGHYIYTSMVWYRELRAGVPGAYRMLANMISYGR